MRNKIRLLLFLIAALSLQMVQAASPKLVVAIVVDQLRYDYLERFQSHFVTNGFRLFMDHGAFMTSARYNYAPTVTGPGHASVASGSTPMIHGIIGNEWFDKRTRKEVGCVSDSSVLGVGGTSTNKGKASPRNFAGSTIADQMRLHFDSKVVGVSMKDRGAILPAGKKPAGAYWFEAKNGDFITSTYYMRELPEWARVFNEQRRGWQFIGQTWERLLDEKFYRFADEAAGEAKLEGETNVTFNHLIAQTDNGCEVLSPTPFANQLLIEFAKAAVEGEGLGQGGQTDMLCVSFSANDACGHKFGPYSHEVQDITLRLDRQLADFFTYLDERIGLANVMIFLTADHGVAPTPEFASEQGLDGHRYNDSALMVDLMSALDRQFGSGKYFVSPKMFYGGIWLNHETLREKGLDVEVVSKFLRETILDTGKFFTCYSREQLLEGRVNGPVGQMMIYGYNPERGADLVVVPKPFGIPGSGKTGTTHGSPWSYDAHVPVLMYGSAFKPGRYPDEFYITDIAATVCAALRIEPPAGSMGKPLVRCLANP